MAGKRTGGKDGKASARNARCPLCGRPVPAQEGEAATLNRHFETDCTWRHTSRSPNPRTRGR
jgi:hypothetical protein